MFVKSASRIAAPRTGFQASFRIDGEATVPLGINDLRTFREWARSDDYPERGDFCWLGNIFWVDLSMEEAHTHGLVKTQYVAVLQAICESQELGEVYTDCMRVSHPGADLSCEPDVMFVSFESFETGAIREIEGAEPGSAIEFEGAPDVSVEIVSASSQEKDRELLPKRLFAAGVKEYWLVDVRGERTSFEIFRRGARRFVKTPYRAGKVRSSVFGCSFRLEKSINRRGRLAYKLSYR